MEPQMRKILFTALLITACDSKPTGLFPTPDDRGPAITFDLARRPLPELPYPNDLATRFDRDSATGRRLNTSVFAPTTLEVGLRQELDLLDGWSTYAPITVAFDEPIDPMPLRTAHANDDFADDVLYVVNLATGEPARLDLGRGSFPMGLKNTDKFFLNDPRAGTSNVVFETVEEVDFNGNGQLDPEEDSDHDGVWDHPNTFGPDPYRDLLTWYEKESNTLIIRTFVPLEQRSTYAVVVTRRIQGTNGAVHSPFPYVNHPSQTHALQPLLGFLGKGELTGLKQEDIAFAWTFTTQSVTKDLEAIHDGLYGHGSLKWLATKVSDRLEPVLYANDKSGVVEEHALHPLKFYKPPAGGDAATWALNPYTVPMNQFEPALRQLTGALGITDDRDSANILDTFKFVDYLVIGSYQTADFIDDVTQPSADGVFKIDSEHGTARLWLRAEGAKELETRALVAGFKAPIAPETLALRSQAWWATRDRVWFMLIVPKAHDGFKAPFPVSIYGHGYTSQRTEALAFAGNMAKVGVATVSIDAYGHGLSVPETDRRLIEAIIGQYGFTPATRAILKGRARDLNNDGLVDSGGDFWGADVFHERDVVRQSVIDWMQLIRVFRAFGTYDLGDLNHDGKPDLAGDFNGDGVVDVGGPDFIDGKLNGGSDFFVWGQSLGGITAGVLPAVEPKIVAAAPVSGAAGLSDTGFRTEQGGVVKAAFLEALGPMLASEPVDGGQANLIFDVLNVNDEAQVKLTTTPLDIKPGDVVEVNNLSVENGEPPRVDRAVVDAQGRFRIAVTADHASFFSEAPVDDNPVHLGVCDPETAGTAAALRMIHPADCLVFKRFRPGAPDLVIDTFPSDIVFQGRHYAKGSPLVAISRGFGIKRGTPELRRFLGLAQLVLDPGDPANYAAHFAQSPLPMRVGNPAAVLVVGTTGDMNVPVNTAYAMARIAGALPYVYDPVKHAAWGRSPNDVLAQSTAMEALGKLNYFRPVAEHLRNPAGTVVPRDQALVDLVTCRLPEHCEKAVVVDPGGYAWDGTAWLDEGNTLNTNGGVPRLKTPLRPEFSKEATLADGTTVTRRSALIMPYLKNTGAHTFGGPHLAEAFDIDLFMINLIAKHFQTRGAELHYETCMSHDGFDRARLKGDGKPDPMAVRVPGCEWIPTFPTTF